MNRFAFAALAIIALAGAARAGSLVESDADGSRLLDREEIQINGSNTAGEDRLMIVNGNSGRVVYDDGRNDLYCVTRRYTVGHDYDGRPIRRRSMNCR